MVYGIAEPQGVIFFFKSLVLLFIFYQIYFFHRKNQNNKYFAKNKNKNENHSEALFSMALMGHLNNYISLMP